MNRIVRRVAPWLAGALLAACNLHDPGAQPDPGAPAPITRATITFSTTEAALEHGVVGTSFALGEMRDLWVRVALPDVPEVAGVTLDFVNPMGETFYQRTQRHARTPGMKEMAMPGADVPVTVFPMKPLAGGGYALDVLVSIGGSNFQRFPYPGRWEVRAHVDGVPGTVVAPFDFTQQR